jgi:heme exporter protein D
MKMEGIVEYLDMGGYAFYVWTSFGLCMGLMIAHLILPRRRERRILGEIRNRLRREAGRA